MVKYKIERIILDYGENLRSYFRVKLPVIVNTLQLRMETGDPSECTAVERKEGQCFLQTTSFSAIISRLVFFIDAIHLRHEPGLRMLTSTSIGVLLAEGYLGRQCGDIFVGMETRHRKCPYGNRVVEGGFKYLKEPLEVQPTSSRHSRYLTICTKPGQAFHQVQINIERRLVTWTKVCKEQAT